MPNLTELAARCEAADGPSYALECLIWDAIYPGERQARFDKLTAPGHPYHRRLGPADVDGYVQPLRAFTASLDAALTLVPEGWDWSLFGRTGEASVHRFHEGKRIAFDSQATTPALALTAASLRAIASKEQSDEG